jgi:hypothetical protein
MNPDSVGVSPEKFEGGVKKMDAMDAILSRRSIRKYTAEPQLWGDPCSP